MYNSVDIKVGRFIRQWVVSSCGSDQIRVDKRTNIWAIVKQNLALLPEDYAIVSNRSEYISIELLDAHSQRSYIHPAGCCLHLNSLYRCYISESGQEAIRRYLENQFRSAFRVYMVASMRDDSREKILHAITSFLLDYDLPVDSRILARLSKDWYRYRQKNGEKLHIPIFF